MWLYELNQNECFSFEKNWQPVLARNEHDPMIVSFV
jgi:hypothetical protein